MVYHTVLPCHTRSNSLALFSLLGCKSQVSDGNHIALEIGKNCWSIFANKNRPSGQLLDFPVNAISVKAVLMLMHIKDLDNIFWRQFHAIKLLEALHHIYLMIAGFIIYREQYIAAPIN